MHNMTTNLCMSRSETTAKLSGSSSFTMASASGRRTVKITAVETLRCGAGFRDFCFVKMTTDADMPEDSENPDKGRKKESVRTSNVPKRGDFQAVDYFCPVFRDSLDEF